MAPGRALFVVTLIFSSTLVFRSSALQESDTSEESDSSEERVHVTLGQWLLDAAHTRMLLEFEVPADSPPVIWTNGDEFAVTYDDSPPSDQVAPVFLQIPQMSWFDNELHALKLQAAGDSSAFTELLKEWRAHEAIPEVQKQIDQQLLEMQHVPSPVQPHAAVAMAASTAQSVSSPAPPSQSSKSSDLTTTRALAYPLSGDDVDALRKQGAFAAQTTGSTDRIAVPPHLKGDFVPNVSASQKVALGGDRWAVVVPLKKGTAAALKKGSWHQIPEASDSALAAGGALTVLLKPVSQELPVNKNSKDAAQITTTTTTTTSKLKPARVSDVLSWLKGGLKEEASNNVPLDDWPTPTVTPGQVDAQKPDAATPLDDWPTPNVPAAKPQTKQDWLKWQPMSADAAVAAVAADAGEAQPQQDAPAQAGTAPAAPAQGTADNAASNPPAAPLVLKKSKGDWLSWKPMDADSAVASVTGEAVEEVRGEARPSPPPTNAAPLSKAHNKALLGKSAPVKTQAMPSQENAVPVANIGTDVSAGEPPVTVKPKSKAEWLSWKPMNADDVVSSVEGSSGVSSQATAPTQAGENLLASAKENAGEANLFKQGAAVAQQVDVAMASKLSGQPQQVSQSTRNPSPPPSAPVAQEPAQTAPATVAHKVPLSWKPMSDDDLVASVENTGEAHQQAVEAPKDVEVATSPRVPAQPQHVSQPAPNPPTVPPVQVAQETSQPVPATAKVGVSFRPMNADDLVASVTGGANNQVAQAPQQVEVALPPKMTAHPQASQPATSPAPLPPAPVAQQPSQPVPAATGKVGFSFRPVSADDLVASVVGEASQQAAQVPKQVEVAMPPKEPVHPQHTSQEMPPAPLAPAPVPQDIPQSVPATAKVGFSFRPMNADDIVASVTGETNNQVAQGQTQVEVAMPPRVLAQPQHASQPAPNPPPLPPAPVAQEPSQLYPGAAVPKVGLSWKPMNADDIVSSVTGDVKQQAAEASKQVEIATPPRAAVTLSNADQSARNPGQNAKGTLPKAPATQQFAERLEHLGLEGPDQTTIQDPTVALRGTQTRSTDISAVNKIIENMETPGPPKPTDLVVKVPDASILAAAEQDKPQATVQEEALPTMYPLPQTQKKVKNWLAWKPPDSSAEVANVLNSLNLKGGQGAAVAAAATPLPSPPLETPGVTMLSPTASAPALSNAMGIASTSSVLPMLPPKPAPSESFAIGTAPQRVNSGVEGWSSMGSTLPAASQTFAMQSAAGKGTESTVNWKNVPGNWETPSSAAAASPLTATMPVSQVPTSAQETPYPVPATATVGFSFKPVNDDALVASVTGDANNQVAQAPQQVEVAVAAAPATVASNDAVAATVSGSAASSGLADLASVDPNSFNIVQALLKKRQQGKLPLAAVPAADAPVPEPVAAVPAAVPEPPARFVESAPVPSVQSENWKLAKDNWVDASTGNSAAAPSVDLALGLSSSPVTDMVMNQPSWSSMDQPSVAVAGPRGSMGEPPVPNKAKDEQAVDGLLDQVARLTGKHVHRHDVVKASAPEYQEEAPAPSHETEKWGNIVESDPGMRILDAAEGLR